MTRPEQHRSSALFRLAITAGLFILLVTVRAAQAQTYTVIHNFTGGADGYNPTSTLVQDRAGNLYGTTENGGTYHEGVLFQLKPTRSGGWIFYPIHEFAGGSDDGAGPFDYGGLTIGPDGNIYGSTVGGGMTGCNGDCSLGVVFRLQPPPTSCRAVLCPWPLSIVYEFGSLGPAYPESNVVFDAAGNLYGTTQFGYAYELSPSGGDWTQSASYYLGGQMTAGLVPDNAGNAYGVTECGGTHSAGVVFELTPGASGWTETVLYNFTAGNDGGYPIGGLMFNQGNLYGSTSYGGSAGGGTIFELSPSGSEWTLTTLCSFGTGLGFYGPQSPLTMDAAGNLYGTTNGDGAFGDGMVFKATRSGSNWTCTDLHDFGEPTGLFPIAGVTVGANGNLYGTATQSGSNHEGVVWQITP